MHAVDSHHHRCHCWRHCCPRHHCHPITFTVAVSTPSSMAGRCVLGRLDQTLWALSLPLGLSSLSSSSPCPPQQRSVRRRHAREKEGVVAIDCLGVNTVLSLCCGRAGKASERMFSWLSLSTTSLKRVFFHKNGHSYYKDKNWIVSACTLEWYVNDDRQLMNYSSSAARKRTQFSDHGGGGGFPWCLKNWKLFVARLSGFRLRKILLDRPK